jgi:L-lactate dehydrogenase complex protein LldG
VAETGTLVMVSSTASPASLAFLPELHIVALARSDIVASFEDAFTRLAAAPASLRLSRAINLISSPSRTSDIGGRSVRGAHGPRRLAVILYGAP